MPWVYASEIFSQAERDAANGLAVGMAYGANAVIVFITPFLLSWSIKGSLVLFGVLNILIAAFCYKYVTETKGRAIKGIFSNFELVWAILGNFEGNFGLSSGYFKAILKAILGNFELFWAILNYFGSL